MDRTAPPIDRTLRPARIDDVPAAVRLGVAGAREGHFECDDPKVLTQQFEQVIRVGPQPYESNWNGPLRCTMRFDIIEAASVPVGFTMSVAMERGATRITELLMIAVEGPHRRRGHARFAIGELSRSVAAGSMFLVRCRAASTPMTSLLRHLNMHVLNEEGPKIVFAMDLVPAERR